MKEFKLVQVVKFFSPFLQVENLNAVQNITLNGDLKHNKGRQKQIHSEFHM